MSAGARALLPSVAARTEGFTGADLQALLYSAQMLAVHEKLERVRPHWALAHGVVVTLR